ncbi:MAG TPA: lipopolysaccharide transport periplasmic protein LptA [Nitrospirota bacterium]|nr:lipopolysaccharide transport periplasmic protein LptA [Nitrospirota bacterium]
MLKRYFRNSLLILASLFLAAATPTDNKEKGKREPMVITSSHMKADKLGDKVTFTGDVVLKKEGMTLYSDSMIVFYDVPTKGVKEIEALGNVVVRKDGRVALSNRASYYSREEKIVLTGDARITENENQLGGQRITLFMRDDRSIVEGGNVRFYQDKNKQPENRRRK